MKEFKSDIDTFLIMQPFTLLIFSILLFSIFHLSYYWALLVIFIMVINQIFIRYGDNNITASETTIRFLKSNTFFQKDITYDKSNIKCIEFWNLSSIFTLIFLPQIKAIKIIPLEGKSVIYFCLGIEEDYYTNSDDDTFENLIKLTYKLKYPIKMTKKIESTIFVLNEKLNHNNQINHNNHSSDKNNNA